MRRAPLLLPFVLAGTLGLLWLALRSSPSQHSGDSASNGTRSASESLAHAAPLEDIVAAPSKREQSRLRVVVHVQDGDGRPVAGAVVRFGEPEGSKASPSGPRKPVTLWHVLGHFFGILPREDRPFARTALSDSEGTAVFEIKALPQRYLELQAVEPEVAGSIQARSEPIAFDRNSREAYVITVLRPAIVRVRLDPRMANASVDLALTNEWTQGPTLSVPSAAVRSTKLVTIIALEPRRLGSEESTFAVFAAGEYRATAWLQRGTSSAVQKVMVDRLGTDQTVTLAFPDQLALAVRGRVLDENGVPSTDVKLTCTIDGQAPIKFDSRADGSFELWHARGDELVLRPESGDLFALCSPAEQRLAFGARDVELRAHAKPLQSKVDLKVFDARNGRPIDAWVVWSVQDGAQRRERIRRQFGNEPMFDAVDSAESVPRFEELEVLVCAHGYADESRRVFEPGLVESEGPHALRVELQRGFRRAFRVQHCSTQMPLGGARVLDRGAVVGVTDAQGVAQVELPEWPVKLRFELDGFEPKWWPSQLTDASPLRDVHLCPVD